jgi:membrane associated rhomboid family serine protease
MHLALGRQSGVAYTAHLAGYACGAAAAIVLVRTGILARTREDIFAWFDPVGNARRPP